MKSDSNVGARERALTEPLDIYFTILHCCKTKTETEREGERREVVGEKKNQSSILFSTLQQATSGSVTLHLHWTISLAKVHKTTKYLVTYCLTCSAKWLKERGKRKTRKKMDKDVEEGEVGGGGCHKIIMKEFCYGWCPWNSFSKFLHVLIPVLEYTCKTCTPAFPFLCFTIKLPQRLENIKPRIIFLPSAPHGKGQNGF